MSQDSMTAINSISIIELYPVLTIENTCESNYGGDPVLTFYVLAVWRVVSEEMAFSWSSLVHDSACPATKKVAVFHWFQQEDQIQKHIKP